MITSGPWWANLRYSNRPAPQPSSDRRRPIAIDYVSAFGLATWGILAARDPEPIYRVNGWQFIYVIKVLLPEPVLIAIAILVAVGQTLSGLSGQVIARKVFAGLASAIYLMFANGIGVDAPHPYSVAFTGALFLGNALVALRTL